MLLHTSEAPRSPVVDDRWGWCGRGMQQVSQYFCFWVEEGLLRSKDGGLSEDCGEFVWSCWRIRGCEAGKSVRPCDGKVSIFFLDFYKVLLQVPGGQLTSVLDDRGGGRGERGMQQN